MAALRADKLVVTRQGVGAFVAEQVRRPFRLEFDENSSLQDVLNILELRTGIEIEAAGLAAERASAAQLRKIGERFAEIEAAIARGETAVDEDFAFHCEIADATGNPQFKRFLEYLGRFVIPRKTVWGSQPAAAQQEPPRHVPARAPRDPRRDPRPLGQARARRDAEPPRQQPPALPEARLGRGQVRASTILVTGAAGGIGTRLRKLLKGVYPRHPLERHQAAGRPRGRRRIRPGRYFRLAAVDNLTKGIDGIVHLGGHSIEGPWETILSANIVGCRNMFEAAYRNGVKRVVFASSNHAVGFYPRSKKIGVDVTVRPDSRYGVSKAFGEAIGALYADKHGLRVTCLRIGNFGDAPLDQRRLSIWLKPEDLVQLIRIGLEHPDIKFEIFYGMSDNARGVVGQFQRAQVRLQAGRQGRGFSRAGDGSADRPCRPIRSASATRAARSARTNTTPTSAAEVRPYFAAASFRIGPSRAISLATSASSAFGPRRAGSGVDTPSSASRFCTASSLSPLFIASASLSTTALGVPLGANIA